MYIFIQALLSALFADDIFITPTPAPIVVLFVFVRDVNPVAPPISEPALISPEIKGTYEVVKAPEIFELFIKLNPVKVKRPIPPPEMAGLFVEFITHSDTVKLPDDDIVIAGASPDKI